MYLNIKEDFQVLSCSLNDAGKGKKWFDISTGTGKRLRSNDCSIIRILISSPPQFCFSGSIRLCKRIGMLLLDEAIYATILVLMWMHVVTFGFFCFLFNLLFQSKEVYICKGAINQWRTQKENIMGSYNLHYYLNLHAVVLSSRNPLRAFGSQEAMRDDRPSFSGGCSYRCPPFIK